MSDAPVYTYVWNNTNGNLVFEFRIPYGALPENMSLRLYAEKDPDDRHDMDSQAGKIIFSSEAINNLPLNGIVWMTGTENGHGLIEADLFYGEPPSQQKLEGGLAIYRAQPFIPIPMVPPVNPFFANSNSQASSPVIDQKAMPLFPFIDVQGWPALSAEVQERYFVTYKKPAVPVDNSFFTTVVTDLDKINARKLIEGAAVDRIESFITNPNPLTGPIAHFARLSQIIEVAAEYDPVLLVEWIAYELKTDSEAIKIYIVSPGYQNMLNEVWQNWFALVIINGGYRPQLFRMLTRTLVFCHFVETIIKDYPQLLKSSPATAVEKQEETINNSTTEELSLLSEAVNKMLNAPPVLKPASPGIRTIEHLLHASILLDASFPVPFPLPPHADQPQLSLFPWKKGWVAPYAVGKLQLVNQKLVGYKSGDLAHIENVMRGEKREIKRRKLSRTEEKESRQETNTSKQLNSGAEKKNNFEQEALKAAAASFTEFTYDNLTSAYGSPTTFTLSGSWKKEEGNTAPVQSSASGFAEYVITKTVQQVNRQVEELRQRVHTDESEESTCSVFDNTHGTGNINGVYRWLNKVYEARVVQYGSRLLIEFLIQDPAATFIAESKRLYGVDLTQPKTLDDFNIQSYKDINFNLQKNNTPPASATASLITPPLSSLEEALLYFNINDWPFEPASQKIVSAVLQTGERLNIPIPEGYAASAAVITLPLNANPAAPAIPVQTINGIIGQATFNNSGIQSPVPISGASPFLVVTLNEETVSIAAVLFDVFAPQQAPITSSDPGSNTTPATTTTTDPPPPVLAEASVTITITCMPAPETKAKWQLHIYRLLLAAAKQKSDAYFNLLATTREKGIHWIPQDVSALEHRSLQQDCMDRLFSVYYSLTGAPAEPLETSTPGTFTIYEPAIAQFFNQSFEWNELSYALLDDVFHRCGCRSNEASHQEKLSGNNLAAFIQAEYARVLVPVHPQMSLAVLYFLETGSVWQGPPEEVPVAAQSLQAAYAVKKERPENYRQSESSPYLFEVPTALLVLDDPNSIFLP
jgi:hypothetical protein